MDPNANLAEALETAGRLLYATDTEAYPDDLCLAEDAERLAQLVLALDGWLRQGGFVPKAWYGPGRHEVKA